MLVTSLLLSMLTTLTALLMLRPAALRSKLLDIPDQRKQHTGAVPLIGGMAIYTGVALATVLTQPLDMAQITWLASSCMIVMLGVADDAKSLSAWLRMGVQALVTIGLCIGGDLYLQNLGNLFGMGDVNLGLLGYAVTVIAVIAAINCFNMIDGMDGLLGSMALVSLTSLALLYLHAEDSPGLGITLIFLAALLPYLLNNLGLPPFRHKIFMGDAGSMLVGLTIVWLLMLGSQSIDDAPPVFRPVTALWLIAVPLMDMARVMIYRARNGIPLFQAGRNHVHHILLDQGLGKTRTLLILTLMAAVLAGVGLLTEQFRLPENIVLAAFLLVFFAYQLGFNYLLRNTDLIRTGQKIPAKS